MQTADNARESSINLFNKLAFIDSLISGATSQGLFSINIDANEYTSDVAYALEDYGYNVIHTYYDNPSFPRYIISWKNPSPKNSISFSLTATGDGSGVSIAIFECYFPVLVTLDGEGKFYSNAEGTEGESSKHQMQTGWNTLYIKVPTGISNMTILNERAIRSWGDTGARGSFNDSTNPDDWNYFNGIAGGGWSTWKEGFDNYSNENSPLVDPSNFINFTKIIDVSIYPYCGKDIIINFSDLPRSLLYYDIGPSDFTFIQNGSWADVPLNILYMNFYGGETDSITNIRYCGVLWTPSSLAMELAVEDIPNIHILWSNGISFIGDIKDIPTTCMEIHFRKTGSIITGSSADIKDSLKILHLNSPTNAAGFTCNVNDFHSSFREYYSNITALVITGNLETMSKSISYLGIYNANITGLQIGDLSKNNQLYCLGIVGSSTDCSYTAGVTWPEKMVAVEFKPTSNGLSSEEVDAWFNDLYNSGSRPDIVNIRSIDLRGANGAATAASATARAALASWGWKVYKN